MNINQYMEKCKEKLNIKSTYALAKAMNVDERVLSNYKKGRVEANDYVCFKVAQILEIDPAYVIADIKSENEKDETKREFFKSFAGTLRKAVNIGLMVSTLLGLGGHFNDRWSVFLRRPSFA